ncbi:hypothetical protein M9H77_35550 [Catharanthus roseus]|uniref:Uncharacterized protein n=1 Tax=Catharanthus roseus TaxID=4058 RepID=A0ACB9ZQ28_CATRO|nr:hypothetical protein M9H77_35550 [Catharanthus roseus]
MEMETTPQGWGERSFVLRGYDPNVDHYLGEDEEEDPDELDEKDFSLFVGEWTLDILKHYLTVNKWQPNFRPFMDAISSTMIWVRLPGLPIEFFNDHLLMRVDNSTGRAI